MRLLLDLNAAGYMVDFARAVWGEQSEHGIVVNWRWYRLLKADYDARMADPHHEHLWVGVATTWNDFEGIFTHLDYHCDGCPAWMFGETTLRGEE